MSDRTSKDDFWNLFGWALLWIGFGLCYMLFSHDSDAPLITINISHQTP